MAFLRPKVFLNVKSTHYLLSRIFSNPSLFPAKIIVSGSLFRSFAGWVFFGISRTIVCSYHWERFQGSLMKWLKLCLAREFLQGNLLCVTGRVISNFLIMGDVCKLMTKVMHRLIECRRGWDAQVVLASPTIPRHIRDLNVYPARKFKFNKDNRRTDNRENDLKTPNSLCILRVYDLTRYSSY